MKEFNLNNFGKKLKLNERIDKKKGKVLSEEEMFVDLVAKLSECWDKSTKLYDLFKINTLEYEEDYYSVIEDLILLKYGIWKTEVILWYIFGRIDLEGRMHPLTYQTDDKEPEEILLKTSQELWDFLIKLEKDRNEE
jgi:hypothetical protein